MVEPIHDVMHLFVGQRIQCRAFGHILADQPVGVLVESAFPSMVGMGKIDRRVQRLADRGMVGKLLAIIGGNRPEYAPYRARATQWSPLLRARPVWEQTLPKTV